MVEREGFYWNVACPICAYSLRGLPYRENVVACPECGARFDVSRLLNTTRLRSWYGTPEFSSIAMPAFYAVLGIISFCLLYTLAALPQSGYENAIAWVMFLLIATGWIWLLGRAVRCVGRLWALPAALAFHLIGGAYLGGLLMLSAGGLRAIVTLHSGEWLEAAQLALISAFGGLLLYLASKADRWIGHHCLKQYRLRIAFLGHAASAAPHLPES